MNQDPNLIFYMNQIRNVLTDLWESISLRKTATSLCF